MSLYTARKLHKLPLSDRTINLAHNVATAADAEGLDEDGVPIVERELRAPIMTEIEEKILQAQAFDVTEHCNEANNDEYIINEDDNKLIMMISTTAMTTLIVVTAMVLANTNAHH